ncbi:MAG: hypothetical protein HY785_23810 [Oscillatoriophycideae cyanobacterium NC_groundwater_1537_Pr4_S-0.65um_50_18]|nr:hypothetical protein [Oscillatoriophycideae cyanobacterium NC_groundwater_1537_Pr4_S-0.65um_50_18]
MKFVKIVLIVLVFVANLAIAQPSWADAPKLTTSPDYAEITQRLADLLNAKSPEDTGYDAAGLQQKIGELKLQKYILESASDWGTCRNETGKTLAVYAHKPQKKAAFTAEQSTLYYLGAGQETDDSWNCDGVLLPSGIKVAGVADQELTEPLAVKFVPGTQFVATANPDTGTVEFNVPPAKVFKAGEGTWAIPSLSQTDIDTQSLNAPIDD